MTDTCNGFIKLANSDEAVGQVVNIGSNEEISILDTFNLIKELMKSDVELVVDEQKESGQAAQRFSDYGVIIEKLTN